MLKISRKMLYAVEAVVDIAYNARPEPVQSKEITRRQNIPQRYLEQVMQQLVRAGVLKGVRGPKGGYRLARERRRITVGEIVRIVAEIEANDDGPGETGSALSEHVVRPLWHRMETEMMEKLEGITIQDLCDEARDGNIPSEAEKLSDFTI